MPGAVPVVLLALLIPTTAWSWRSSGLTRGRVPLALGWTWLWAELGCLIAFAPPPPPPVVPIYQAGGRHGLPVAPDMVRMPRPDPQAPTLLFIGDSFTAGQGVALARAFPSLLADALRQDTPGLVALNHGVLGDSFFSAAMRHALVSRNDAPDVIVWTFFLNDLGLQGLSAGDLVSPNHPSWPPPSPLWTTLSNLARARATTQATEDAYHRALSPKNNAWAPFVDTLTRTIQATTSRGARFVFVVFPALYRLDDYPFAAEHDRLAEVARAAGAEVVDLRHAFADQDEASLWVHPADHHPDRRGHAIAAQALLPVLRDAGIPDSAAPDCAVTLYDPRTAALERDACLDPSPGGLLRVADGLVQAGLDDDDAHVDALPAAASLAWIASRRLGDDPRQREILARIDTWMAAHRAGGR